MASELSSYGDPTDLLDDVAGFMVEAPDGRVGKVVRVNYARTLMVVSTGRWPFLRYRMVPSFAIARVEPRARTVTVRVQKDEIESGPEYDALFAGEEEHESEVERYYRSRVDRFSESPHG